MTETRLTSADGTGAESGGGPDTVLVLGDSISLGAAEVTAAGIISVVADSYVNRLRRAFALVVDADVHRTTGAALKTLDAVLSAHRPSVVLVMLGGNDADLDWRRFVLSDGRVIRSKVPVGTYETNLRQIVETVRCSGAVVVLTDMPNHHFELRGPYISKLIDKDVTTLLISNGGQAASDLELVKYRNAVGRVAAECGCRLVDYGRLLGEHPAVEMIGVDGVHPSAKAHRLIADALSPALAEAMVEAATRQSIPTDRR